MQTVILAFALMLGGLTAAGAVNAPKALLTAIDLKACKQVAKHRDGGAWRCPGLPGYPVYVAEGDLRFMLAFGPTPEKRRSATQTLGAFNTLFDGRQRPTIEWRVQRGPTGRETPFATIVRYHTKRDGQSGDVLVITKVDAQTSCQLAKIDATANPDAMATARAWADEEARKASCPDQPLTLGKAGNSPM